MAKAPRKKYDPNVSAFKTLQAITGAESGVVVPAPKNPAAVALGRLGGLKGGKARAEKLTSKRKSAIAKMAAMARWHDTEQT